MEVSKYYEVIEDFGELKKGNIVFIVRLSAINKNEYRVISIGGADVYVNSWNVAKLRLLKYQEFAKILFGELKESHV